MNATDRPDRPPRVAIDVTSAVGPRPSGVARYIRGLVGQLLSDDGSAAEFRPHLLCRASRWRGDDPRKAFGGAPVVRWLDGPFSPRCDLFHAPDLRPPRRTSSPLVVTIHDLSALDRDDHASARFIARKRAQFGRAMRHAARVITHTESVRAALIDRFDLPEDRTVAVPLWPALIEGLDDAILSDRLLVVGGPSRRKRSDALVPFLERFESATGLVPNIDWCGSAPPEEAEAFLASLPLAVRDRVHWLGHVDDSELDRRMRGARALLQLSDTEGFGIPLVEAARRGLPAIVRRSETAEEVLSFDGAFWWDGGDEQEQLKAFTIEEERTRRTLEAARRVESLSLERTVRETRAVYRAALRTPGRRGATSAAG